MAKKKGKATKQTKKKGKKREESEQEESAVGASAVAATQTSEAATSEVDDGKKAPTVVEFTEEPMKVTCPHCDKTVTTTTSKGNGWCTWIICLLIFMSVVCCLMMWLPFCCACTKDTVHSCPKCQRPIGRARKCNKY